MFEEEEQQMSSGVQVIHTDEVPVMRAWPPVANKGDKIIIRGRTQYSSSVFDAVLFCFIVFFSTVSLNKSRHVTIRFYHSPGIVIVQNIFMLPPPLPKQ